MTDNTYKNVRDDFLNHLDHYKQMTTDDYTATQMAAIATRTEHGLSKEQFLNIINKD